MNRALEDLAKTFKDNNTDLNEKGHNPSVNNL